MDEEGARGDDCRNEEAVLAMPSKAGKQVHAPMTISAAYPGLHQRYAEGELQSLHPQASVRSWVRISGPILGVSRVRDWVETSYTNNFYRQAVIGIQHRQSSALEL